MNRLGYRLLMGMLLALTIGATSVHARPETDESIIKRELQIPAEWNACTANSECNLVAAGCNGERKIAVNTQHQAEALKLATDKYGDPKTINCISSEKANEINFIATCSANACMVVGERRKGS